MNKRRRCTESQIPFIILALLTPLVTAGGFLVISTNLMMTLSSFIPDCDSRYNFDCEYGHPSRSDQAVAAFVTLAIAHLALSITIMMVFLLGHNISGLTFNESHPAFGELSTKVRLLLKGFQQKSACSPSIVKRKKTMCSTKGLRDSATVAES